MYIYLTKEHIAAARLYRQSQKGGGNLATVLGFGFSVAQKMVKISVEPSSHGKNAGTEWRKGTGSHRSAELVRKQHNT